MPVLTKSKISGALLILWAATMLAAQAQSFQTVFTFNGENGQNPGFGNGNVFLAQGRDGALYDTSEGGGTGSNGTVFKVNLSGLTTLYNFCNQDGCPNGAEPISGVILATDGNFYGVTYQGGGSVFKITPAGKMTTLYTFCSKPDCEDGSYPSAPLVQGPDGSLYGTTSFGGKVNGGSVFRITPSGRFTTIYSFCAQGTGCPSGSNPYEPMIVASDGSLYGVTPYGGVLGGCTSTGCGTVFKITRAGVFSVVHAFNESDGGQPTAIIQAVDGNLYGGTAGYGPEGAGTIFRLTLEGTFKTLHSFDQHNFSQGEGLSGIQQGSDGNLYGSTQRGGDVTCDEGDGCGVFFQFTLDGTLTPLYPFHGTGFIQFSTPMQSTNGQFYGTTFYGGSYGDGTIYQISIGLSPFVAFVQASGKVGQTAQILGLGQRLKGTTSVSFNGVPADFEVRSGTFLIATIPSGATTGYVAVTTPTGVLKSNVPFRVFQ